MEADISGHQRKVVASEVRPARVAHGRSGITLKGGRSLPFVVSRKWNAPAGNYPEQWFLVEPESREVLYEGPVREVLVFGLQSLTEAADVVNESLALSPGTYLIVFALGGIMGGQIEVEASEPPAEEAA